MLSGQTTDITPAQPTLVPQGTIKPLVIAKDMSDNMEVYQDLVNLLLTDHDRLVISGKPFIRKSGWLKLAVPFNISIEIAEESKEKLSEDGKYFAYHFTVRASVPNVRHVEEVGTCDNTESDKPGMSAHVIRTMAKTRATSRAIAAMMGKSEQSAEDMESIPKSKTEPATTEPASNPTEKQLVYIKTLGYTGVIPTNKFDASKLIEQLKKEKGIK